MIVVHTCLSEKNQKQQAKSRLAGSSPSPATGFQPEIKAVAWRVSPLTVRPGSRSNGSFFRKQSLGFAEMSGYKRPEAAGHLLVSPNNLAASSLLKKVGALSVTGASQPTIRTTNEVTIRTHERAWYVIRHRREVVDRFPVEPIAPDLIGARACVAFVLFDYIGDVLR